MAVVTVKEMREALRKTIGRKGMDEEDINKLADYLFSLFGYHHEVIDNRLTMDERDVLYMLEEEGLLTTRQEEVHLKKGKLWRIHYWILKADHIKRLALPEQKGTDVDYKKKLYNNVSNETWERE